MDELIDDEFMLINIVCCQIRW